MPNLSKGLAAILLTAFSTAAIAQASIAGSYANLSADDLSFGVVNINAAFEFRAQNSQFSLMPELRLGIGVQDDTLFGTNVEVDEFQSVALRLNYYASDTIAVFIVPSYARLGIQASQGGFSSSASETEFGLGLGVSGKIADEWAVEGSYERYDDTNVLSAAIRYYF
ncbi:outer membrane beta-barrel protein [Glaciecola sp. SC05]|uniref:outer membrane beta-barrel protein n=1 Tax=Glaciecola sp. SC05 TaxID=1987355 RepID=UPI0035277DCB